MAREVIAGKRKDWSNSGDFWKLRRTPPPLTVVVPLAEQLQEAEQVLCELVISHDFLSWVGGRGAGRGQMC